jgi:tetratricopeptide (TPR) repeat protein
VGFSFYGLSIMIFIRPLILLLVSSLFSCLANATPQALGSAPRLTLPADQTASPADQDYAEGIKKLAANDTEGAELAFNRALKKQPDHANSLLGLAEIAHQRQHPELAAKLIKQAVKAAPDNANAQASLGRLLAVQKKYPEAEKALKKAAELDPKLIRPRMDLADLYATVLGKPSAALSLYGQVLDIDPNHAGANYAYGVTLMRVGDLTKARAALETSARLAPANPLPLLALARLSLQQKELDEALILLERALTIQPTLADALELRGDIQQARRSPDKALADYSAAVLAQPDLVTAWLKQGIIQQQLGQYEEAKKSYLAAIKLDLKLSAAYNNLAWMETENRKNLEQAEVWAKKAVQLSPEIADYHDTLGWVYRARGNLKDAELSLQRATRLQHVPASVFYHLGVVLQEMGKPQEAAVAFEKALTLDKNYPAAQQALQRLQGR